MNGTVSQTFAGTTPSRMLQTNNFIGCYNATQYLYTGLISDFRVYETALNNAQINSIVYSAFLPTVPFNLAPFSWSTAAPTGYSTTKTDSGLLTIPSAIGAFCPDGRSGRNQGARISSDVAAA